MRVAKRPLDRDAVKAANEALWKNHSALNRRKLTMKPADAAYRKEWMDAYLANLDEAAEPPAPVLKKPVASPAVLCEEAAPAAGVTKDDIAAIQKLIDEGKKQEAIDKTVEVLKKAGFDMSVMRNGKPTYDSSLESVYGITKREKDARVSLGDPAFNDASSLLTTVAHERKHAEQWQDPEAAAAMGSDGRELEAYFVEVENEKQFDVDKSMRDNNRKFAKKKYENLSDEQKREYKKNYERVIGPVPE